MTSEKVKIIRERIVAKFQPPYLEVLDESDQHIGHAGHQGGGRHFAVLISKDTFKDMSRVAAHRAIYALFTDMMPDEIHALRIQFL